jgi:hypothetical protein
MYDVRIVGQTDLPQSFGEPTGPGVDAIRDVAGCAGRTVREDVDGGGRWFAALKCVAPHGTNCD